MIPWYWELAVHDAISVFVTLPFALVSLIVSVHFFHSGYLRRTLSCQWICLTLHALWKQLFSLRRHLTLLCYHRELTEAVNPVLVSVSFLHDGSDFQIKMAKLPCSTSHYIKLSFNCHCQSQIEEQAKVYSMCSLEIKPCTCNGALY